jgi:hypothetical protein
MRSLLILFLLSAVFTAEAQPYLDLGQLSFHTSPGGEPDRFQHLRAQVNIPKIFKDSSVLVINPIWEERWIQMNKTDPNIHLRGAITWFTFTKHFNKHWELLTAFIPRWNGEPSVQFKDGFQAGFAVAAIYKPRPGLSYRLGFYYNREFFGNFFVPVWGIDWKINKRQRLFGMLPGFFTYENRISKHLAWGGNFRTFTNSYKTAPQTPNGSNGFIRIDDNQVGAYLDYYCTPRIVVNLEAGYSLFRKTRSGTNSKADMVYMSKDNAPYLRAVIQYRLRFDKSPFK